MKLWDSIKNSIGYVFDGIRRIFGPSDDEYPNTGVQPFEGDTNQDQRQQNQY
ncbi:isochorismate synthase [Geitlerinema sp. PCC 9228]|jgi:hypothetical protein|uniref:isochorismate synthase n=1 Tax=Geitlerinema sp. PCC 9228 TaxID=111611 RepID=UPI001114E956|nr:isochorismate synthase [Geitlerinema sp. PCC 9228]